MQKERLGEIEGDYKGLRELEELWEGGGGVNDDVDELEGITDKVKARVLMRVGAPDFAFVFRYRSGFRFIQL